MSDPRDDRLPGQRVTTFPKVVTVIFFVVAIGLLIYALLGP